MDTPSNYTADTPSIAPTHSDPARGDFHSPLAHDSGVIHERVFHATTRFVTKGQIAQPPKRLTSPGTHSDVYGYFWEKGWPSPY